MEGEGGKVVFVRLTLTEAEQERRVIAPSRAAFGKLRSLELLRSLQPALAASTGQMPQPDIAIDTGAVAPAQAAQAILAALEPQPG